MRTHLHDGAYVLQAVYARGVPGGGGAAQLPIEDAACNKGDTGGWGRISVRALALQQRKQKVTKVVKSNRTHVDVMPSHLFTWKPTMTGHGHRLSCNR